MWVSARWAVNSTKVDNLGVSDRDPLRAILTSSRRCQSLSEWFTTTLESIEEQLGFGRSSLLVVLRGGPRSVHRAFAGAAHGWEADVLAEYFERWAQSDPLATERAHAMFERDGIASTAELYPALAAPQRRFVDRFLRSLGVADQLSLRLPGNGTTDGYLTLHEPEVIDRSQRLSLERLAPGLAEQLRSLLPRGLPGRLSARERQAAELVALGFTNREIAAVMNIREDSVKKHLYRVMSKLDLQRRTQLAVSWTTGRRLALSLSPTPNFVVGR